MRALTALFTFLLLSSTTYAAVKPARCFSDHMVLQRDMPVPVYGSAEPGEQVVVTIAGQTKEVTTDGEGRWRVELDPLKAGGPHAMTIAGATTVEFNDILIGDVWIGSGQSNMAGAAGGYAKRDDVLAKWIADGPYPNLRLLSTKTKTWVAATPETAKQFSAILFAFGLTLHRELDVPIGLYVGAVGGTPSGLWVPPEAFFASAECERLYNEGMQTYSHERQEKLYKAKLAAWERAVAKAEAEGEKPRGRKPKPPVTPPPFKELKPGGLFDRYIRQMVGYGIRGVLWDQGEAGTKILNVDQFTMMGALIEGWRDLWGQNEFPWIYVQKPSGGGCAFGQENDPVTRMADAFKPLPAQVSPKDNGLYRELHNRIMQHPNTHMAIARDLGSTVHPPNKSGYGTRAAQVALAKVYGKDVACYGPMYASHRVERNKIRISFTHVGQGLTFRHADTLQGFAIAGEDDVFHWADAVIDGATVVVSSSEVPSPVAVRYAWARTAPWANLFNKDGLPALAFQTEMSR